MQSIQSDTATKLFEGERLVALMLGVLFLGVGLAGFVPSLLTAPAANAPHLISNDGYGNLFGLFPTNYLHNAIHVVVGVLGIAAAMSASGALVYNQLFAVSYVAIVLMGLLPGTNTTFGVMPVFGNNVWLNALTAAIAGYAGFYKPTKLMSSSN